MESILHLSWRETFGDVRTQWRHGARLVSSPGQVRHTPDDEQQDALSFRQKFDTRPRRALSSHPVSFTDQPSSKKSTVQATAIIPARYHSTRLPGKPLLPIADQPMILHVMRRASAASSVARAIVATDDERIFRVVHEAGYEAMMTSLDHASGSDRLAEVAAALEDIKSTEIVVNVQGDEPLISPRTIERAINELANDDEAQVITTCERITNAGDAANPDVVKVVMDERGRALYFSRAPVPYPRDAVRAHGSLARALERDEACLAQFRKHTGLYVYRRRFLLEYARWPPSPLEQLESLEQLRILERGFCIRVIETNDSSIGVDTMEDYERVRAMIEAEPDENLIASEVQIKEQREER